MYVLVDWDNLEQSVRRQGPRYVADLIWTKLVTSLASHVNGVIRLDVRFYGGWYGRSKLTNRGAQLAADVQRDFPFILRSSGTGVTINGELAQALLRLPKHTLPHTFRRRQGPPQLTCIHPAQLGCVDASCPMIGIHQLFTAGTCSATSCSRRIDQLLGRDEQKLVDNMLVADLIHLANLGEPYVSVVSSDDDLWPGMLMAMDIGSQVIQLCTKYPSTHNLYRGTLYGRYFHERL